MCFEGNCTKKQIVINILFLDKNIINDFMYDFLR